VSRVARASWLAAATAAVALAGCTDVGTDPDSVVSIKADTTPVVSVIAGDTLRDTTGLPFALLRLGKAYNGQGQQLAAPSTQILLTPIADSTGSTTPKATIVRTADSASYLVALPGPLIAKPAVGINLQFSRALRLFKRIEVVPRPDLVVRDSASAPVVTLADTVATKATGQFGVRVTFDNGGARSPVRQTLVRFTISSTVGKPYSPRIDSIRFVEPTGRDSSLVTRLDTTDDNGLATRSLTIYRSVAARRRVGGVSGRDTIGVQATVLAGAKPFVLSIPLVLTVIDTVPLGTSGATRAPFSIRRP
jgi:hypothetical protein